MSTPSPYGGMESRAKVLAHPVHPILVVFPLGLLATATLFDVIYLFNENGRLADAAYWMIAAGVVSGLAAAVAGWIDWFAIPGGTRAKRVGLWHGLGNVVVLLLFAASWLLRTGSPDAPPAFAIVLSVAGSGLAFLTGWLGGELIHRLGVSVDDGANLDAPSSFSGPAVGPGGAARRGR